VVRARQERDLLRSLPVFLGAALAVPTVGCTGTDGRGLRKTSMLRRTTQGNFAN
jgi:hypothetical protein